MNLVKDLTILVANNLAVDVLNAVLALQVGDCFSERFTVFETPGIVLI